MAVFTLATDYLCEMGYPFDNSRQIGNTSYVLIWNGKGFNFEWTIRLTLSVNFDGQFEDGLSVSDSLCTAAPSPQKKIGEGVSFRGVCWGGGDCAQARLTSLKTANNEIPVSSVFNDSEGLYRNKTVCRCLAHRIGLIIPRVQCVSGPWSERVFSSSDTPPNCLHRDCVGRRRTGTSMAMSTLASEKSRELLFIGNVFYKQWHL